jgi:adenylate cyclase
MSGLLIEISDCIGGASCTASFGDGPIEIGRQHSEQNRGIGPLLKVFRTADGKNRINIACAAEVTISREQLRLEPLPNGLIRATRKVNSVPIEVEGHAWRDATPKDLSPDTRITLVNGRFEVCVLSERSLLQSLHQPSIAPGRSWPLLTAPSLGLSATLEPESLLEWFQQITAVLESATSNEEFHSSAARAMVEMLHLDSGQVLLLEAGNWKSAAQSGTKLPHPSARVLAHMTREKRTFWEVPTVLHDNSLDGVQAVVTAPILDREENVIGALYGDRRGRAADVALISRLEAMVVRMLACGVAAGLARLEQQKAAAAAQVRFEQFFTQDLSRALAAQPDLLLGRDANVTVLFCDIRGFSRISSRLRSASALVDWLSEVMSVLSDCVVAEEGVLVDYIGDELMAMWGAPASQPDHAARACRAGIAMLNTVAELSPRWQERLGESTSVGIGVNSGPVFVGNTGSRRKFKYGPLGTTVNMASRVQGATKYFGAQMIITMATRQQLPADFPSRRLRLVNVVNISDPVELHEVFVDRDRAHAALTKEYESALTAFENGQYAVSVGILGKLLGDVPNDLPSRLLLSQASQALVNPLGEVLRAWQLPSK